MLTSPMAEQEIVASLARHFDDSIARELRPAWVKSVEQMTEILHHLETEKRIRKDARKRIESEVTEKKKEESKKSGNGKFLAITTGQGEDNADRRGNPKYYGRSYRNSDDKYRRRELRYDRNRTADRENEEATSSDDAGKKPTIKKKETKRTSTKDKSLSQKVSEGKETDRRNRTKIAAIQVKEELEEAETSDDQLSISIVRTEEIIKNLDELCKERQSSHKKPEPFVKVKLGPCRVRALIDTGAQISMVTKNLYEKLRTNGVNMTEIPITKFPVRGAFSDKGEIIAYKIFVEMEIENKKFNGEFYIAKKLPYQMLLGIEFLTAHRAVIDCATNHIGLQLKEETKVMVIKELNLQDAKQTLDELMFKYNELFSEEIGCVKHYQHKIELTTNAPFKAKTYPIPEIHRDKVLKHIGELEIAEIIEKAATQYINPLVAVIKKTGEIRLCLDARELNKRMVNDHAQPPTIDEVFRRIGHKKYFSTLDVTKAFWQIPLEETSKKYTGFMVANQSYVFRRMPFGLKTAGASFTRAMNLAMEEEEFNFMIIYLDDILIASDSLEEHLDHLNIIFERLQRKGFKLNKEKCQFLKREITFLGHTFSEISAEIVSETKEEVTNFPRPKNKKALQSFLGLVNWERRFIKNLARMTKPLEELLKKDRKFIWTEKEQEAFMEIKGAFEDADNLCLIRPGLPFGVFIDASTHGLGARLYQYDDEGRRFTVAYASRSLKGAEVNYTITELECLALVWSLRKWHTLLMGRRVKIHTDHKALKFLSSCSQNSTRIARWFEFLQEFDLEIEHVPGKQNAVADTLSRLHARESTNRCDERAKLIGMINNHTEGEDTTEWYDFTRQAQEDCATLREKIQEDLEAFYKRDGLVRFRNANDRERIPIPDEVAWELIKRIHKLLLHFDTDKTKDFAERYFAIRNLDKLTRDVVASCITCIATKYYTRPTVGINYYELPEVPGHTVSIDIFGPLPKDGDGYQYILVILDHFLKLTKFYSMKNQKLETITEILQGQYIPEIGKPREILTDKGGQFTAFRWMDFGVINGITMRHTSPYNSQSNPVERVMRELGRVIRAYAYRRQTRWREIIPRLERTINATAHRSTGLRPVDLHENINMPLRVDERLEPVDQPILGRREIMETAKTNLRKRAEERARQAEKKLTAPVYQVGDRIWLKVHKRSDRSRGTAKKIFPIYDGPYKVTEIVRPNVYLVKDEYGNIMGTFNSRQIRPHRKPRLKPHRDARRAN